MKSPPLVVCVTGSFIGGIASAAASRGPGGAALARGAEGAVAARAGAVRAAAPAIVAPFKKLRRPESGELRLAMIASRGTHGPQRLRACAIRTQVSASICSLSMANS
jgi:hypothetical protein